MNKRIELLAHPGLRMAVVLSLGLLATGIIFDLPHLLSGHGHWLHVAYWVMLAGVVGGLAAAPFGLGDYLATRRRTAR